MPSPKLRHMSMKSKIELMNHRPKMRVLVYSGDPGGAEAVAPVLAWFPKEWDSKVLAKKLAVPFFREQGSRPTDCSTWSWEAIEKKCGEWNPSAMLISASSLPEKDPTEMRLRRWANSKAIPIVAIMDSWQNYAMRFRDPVNGKIVDLPNRIAVMDRGALKDMVADGFPKKILVVTGHPGLESVGAIIRKKKGNGSGKQVLRICHFSQPIRDFWGSSLGYDEFGVAKDIIGLIPQLVKELKRQVRLDIKLHPKESRVSFLGKIGKLPNGVAILPDKTNALSALINCDVAVGMGTIVLVKAALCGVPAICYAPGKPGSVENSCIIAKRKLIPTIRSAKKLAEVLIGLASASKHAKHLQKQEKFGKHQGAADRVVQILESPFR